MRNLHLTNVFSFNSLPDMIELPITQDVAGLVVRGVSLNDGGVTVLA